MQSVVQLLSPSGREEDDAANYYSNLKHYGSTMLVQSWFSVLQIDHNMMSGNI